jgi:hypothetical protein
MHTPQDDLNPSAPESTTPQGRTVRTATTARTLMRAAQWAAVAAAVAVAGCATKRDAPAPAPAPAATPAPAPAAAGLPSVRSMADYRRRAAQLIMAANPSGTYSGPVPEPLYGIVVVTLAFNADGSLRSTNFMRASKVGPEVNDMAIAAVRRVGNFGAVGNLPGPWEFNETFFYNDARKFALVTIVENR